MNRDKLLGLFGLVLFSLCTVCWIAHLSSRIDVLSERVEVESALSHELLYRSVKSEAELDKFFEKVFD